MISKRVIKIMQKRQFDQNVLYLDGDSDFDVSLMLK